MSIKLTLSEYQAKDLKILVDGLYIQSKDTEWEDLLLNLSAKLDKQLKKTDRKEKPILSDKATFDSIKEKLSDILYRSKQGKSCKDRENQFAEACYRRWPLEYSNLEKAIHYAIAKTINPFY